MIAATMKALNVIELLRVSSDKQDVARQEYDTAENREQFNLNVLRTIRLKISGTKVLTNEDVQHMIEELQRPGVDAVSISAIDRLFRPQDYEGLLMLQYFHKHRKALISTKEGYVEPWTDRGWEICMTAAQKAGSELRELKRRTKGGRRKAHAEKRMCNTTPPYGYAYVSKYERDADGRCQYFKEDPAESSIAGLSKKQVVRDIFHWRFYNQMRTSTIQRTLNKKGILTAGRPGGKPGPWSRQVVIQLLKNRHYVGEHWEGGTMLPCPQFVEREVFDGVQKMWAEAKAMTNGRPSVKHLLVSFLRCRKCGRRYRTYHARRPYYICGNYDYKLRQQRCLSLQVACHKLDALVWGDIWRHLTDADVLLANARAYYDALPSSGAARKLEAELAAVTARMERTRRMVRTGTEDEDTGTRLILEDKRRIAEIEAELHMAGSVMTLPPAYVIESACRRIATGPEPGTFAERRPILEKLVDFKVTFGADESGKRVVEIEGKIPVPEAVKKPGFSRKGAKCNDGESGYYTSTLAIPFRIKRTVA